MQAQSCITIRTAAADVVLVVLNSFLWLCRKLWSLASNNLAALSRCGHNNRQCQVLISFLAYHQQQPPRLKSPACKQLASSSPWCRLSCLTWQTWAEVQGLVWLVPLPTPCHRGPSSRKVCTPGVYRGSTPCVRRHPQ